jgi:hypothetical protein
VSGTDETRRDAIPDAIEPERGQLCENSANVSSSKDLCHVFQEHEPRSNFANDAEGVRPEVAFIEFTDVRTCGTPGLTWEARSDDIHDSTPRSAIEGSDVVPDWEQVQQAVPLASEEHFSAIRLFFHGADGSPAERSACEQPAASSGK